MYPWFRPWLFRFEPELVHQLTLKMIGLAGHVAPIRKMLDSIYHSPPMPVNAFGLGFKNPVGLAAGYDKDATSLRGLACLGFSHIEIGTVTLRPQAGNPTPRVFRLVEDEAIINRMGFPGQGAERIMKRLRRFNRGGLIVGVNIGKNKDTRLEQAGDEYAELVRRFASLADYITINVSSPNTVGLRSLQSHTYLESLLTQVAVARQKAVLIRKTNDLPVLVKLAPDLEPVQLEEALEVIQSTGMDGVIVANTTVSRPGLSSRYGDESGGLSGAPLFQTNLKMVKQVVALTHGRLPVVGVGGIMDSSSARQMLDAGAVLVQLYTGLIYKGPGLVKKIVQSLETMR